MVTFVVGLLIQGALGFLGMYVTFKPPVPTQHRRFLMVFAVLTVSSIWTGIQQERRHSAEQKTSEAAQALLQRRLDERLDSINTGIGTSNRQIVEEIRKFAPPSSVATVAVPPTAPKASKGSFAPATAKAPTSENPAGNSEARIEKGLADLKNLIVGQKWGLSAEQLANLSQRVSQYPDRKITITGVMGDPESDRFADSLVAAFKTGNWTVSSAVGIFAKTPEGIVVKVRDRDVRPAGLGDFVRVVRDAGIEPIGVLDTKLSPDDFQIIVGRKPAK